ncbi:MAG: hypothetical protein FD143_643 [Ignavibacteria bacterium]|nr:MAG: hypothetical protein FD143_643 [Ignavibacteria bacterium]KAF0161473.1 MAG: hypothetical protein FD188_844 [Ignavibacteria bacterium]
MEKTLLLQSENMSNTQKALFMVMGILLLTQGGLNFNEAALFGWIQITVGLFSLFLVMYLILSRNNLTSFIKIVENGIYFKKHPFTKEIFIKSEEIRKLEFSKSLILVTDNHNSYKISLQHLTYKQRKEELSNFLRTIEEFKVINKISDNVPNTA